MEKKKGEDVLGLKLVALRWAIKVNVLNGSVPDE